MAGPLATRRTFGQGRSFSTGAAPVSGPCASFGVLPSLRFGSSGRYPLRHALPWYPQAPAIPLVLPLAHVHLLLAEAVAGIARKGPQYVHLARNLELRLADQLRYVLARPATAWFPRPSFQRLRQVGRNLAPDCLCIGDCFPRTGEANGGLATTPACVQSGFCELATIPALVPAHRHLALPLHRPPPTPPGHSHALRAA